MVVVVVVPADDAALEFLLVGPVLLLLDEDAVDFVGEIVVAVVVMLHLKI